MRISNKALIALIAVILALAAVVSVILFLSHPAGTQVLVTVDGQVFGTYDLHTNQTVTIGPEDGSWHNTLKIADGEAAIVDSDCSNQICVYTPALTEDTIGIIVCLPHGVAVELREPSK